MIFKIDVKNQKIKLTILSISEYFKLFVQKIPFLFFFTGQPNDNELKGYLFPLMQKKPTLLPRAAASHSFSVGRRLPAHWQYFWAWYQVIPIAGHCGQGLPSVYGFSVYSGWNFWKLVTVLFNDSVYLLHNCQ